MSWKGRMRMCLLTKNGKLLLVDGFGHIVCWFGGFRMSLIKYVYLFPKMCRFVISFSTTILSPKDSKVYGDHKAGEPGFCKNLLHSRDYDLGLTLTCFKSPK